jgi:hypothetical protein
MNLTYRFHEGVLSVGEYTGREVQVLNQDSTLDEAQALGWREEETAQWQAEHCYQWQRLPLVISREFRTLDEAKLFTILMHHLNNPAEARALAGPIAKKLPKFLGRGSWMITSDMLDDLVMQVFVETKERVSGRSDIQYLGGERRDTLRQLQ